MAVLQDTFEFPRILWNLKVHYRPHTSLLVPNPRMMNPVHILSSQFFSLNPTIIYTAVYQAVALLQVFPPRAKVRHAVPHYPPTSSSY
jgi:hypothetical protein